MATAPEAMDIAKTRCSELMASLNSVRQTYFRWFPDTIQQAERSKEDSAIAEMKLVVRSEIGCAIDALEECMFAIEKLKCLLKKEKEAEEIEKVNPVQGRKRRERKG